MRKLLYLLYLLMFSVFLSCDVQNGNTNKSANVLTSQAMELPNEICDLISREMISSHFMVNNDIVKLIDETDEMNTMTSKCGFQWKKSNFEQIQDKRIEKLKAYSHAYARAMEEEGESTIYKLSQFESAYNTVQIGDFQKFKNERVAINYFENTHKILTAEELNQVNQVINDKMDDSEITEQQREVGNELTKSIARNMEFTPIYGIGDQAFYDHLDRSLDVRYGTIAFSVYIDTEYGFETNIRIAKEIAQEVWESL